MPGLNGTREKRRLSGTIVRRGRAVVTSIAHRTDEHAAWAVTVIVGLDSDVTVTAAGRPLARGPVVVIPPNTAHASVAGAAASFFYDPLDFPQSARFARGPGPSHAPDGRLGQWMASALRSHRGAASDVDVLEGLSREFLDRLPAERARHRDARVRRLLEDLGPIGLGIERVQAPGAADLRQTVERAAQRAGITVAHLRALFVRDVGLQLRSYQRWWRLTNGMCLLGGFDPTRAAHQAGFSDLAHFSRACREGFGSSPPRMVAQLIS